MNTYVIDAMPSIIDLGNQHENNATIIEIDVAAWLTEYPGASLSITYTRSGETTVYPASGVVLDENTLEWTIGAAVTDVAGNGTMIIKCVLGDVEKRSIMAYTHVAEGHAATGTAPEPLADYIDKWGAVDVAVTEKAPGATLAQEVTQDETGTHFAFEVHEPEQGIQGEKGDKGDTGNVMFASFDIDTDTGDLIMTTPDGYTGPTFAMNETTGDLEVTI